MPTQPPRGEARTRAQHVAHQGWHQRRLRLAQVHSSVQRCRLGTDWIRLGKAGVRDLGMARCGGPAPLPGARDPMAAHGFSRIHVKHAGSATRCPPAAEGGPTHEGTRLEGVSPHQGLCEQ